MTERIYSTDAYADAVDATVVEVDDERGAVLLDRTVFYPGGGGQPADRGALWVGEDRLTVDKVAADARGVWHVLGAGDERDGDIDIAEQGRRLVIGDADGQRTAIRRRFGRGTGERRAPAGRYSDYDVMR